MTRICGKTGLSLVDGPELAYRVAKESYGPLNPQERGLLSDDRSTWYRFDTPGRTIYAAEDPTTAMLEPLSWARMTASHEAYLRKTAAFFGEPVETIRQEVEEQWRANGNMIPRWIPANWRDGRLLYSLQFEPGPWVDIAHSETLAAAQRGPRQPAVRSRGGGNPDVGRSNQRTAGSHTILASWIRDQILDDGSYPMGIRFPSKHGAVGQGNGYCWAFWLRRADVGLMDDPVTADTGTEIHENDPAYTYALGRHGIRSR